MSIVPHKKVDRTEYKRKYRQNNKEKIAKYYQDNKEKLAKYREDNKEKKVEYDKKYYQDNKEKLVESLKKYRQNNKEKLIVRRAKTRANKKNVPFNIDEDYIKKIWPKHNICPIFKIKLEQSNLHTGDQSPSLDRIIPKLGYVKGNVQIMSNKANTIKNNATFEELIIIGKYYEKQLAIRT
tara:strand:- start:47 stop:589 length:543 start_codon:yes stop_codon:yes gene_type:complete